MRAACLYTVRSLSKIEFRALLFGKRVQRYDLFTNWQNVSATFFQEFAKKTAFGQKRGNDARFQTQNRGYLSR